MPSKLDPAPDVVVVGNAMKRGLPVVEAMLDRGLRYVSGPQWLREHLLRERWVLAVAGTHGKTTTASMLAWVLEDAGLDPGFLIGGVPQGFGVSARLGSAPFFVVEADEYDTAFFDKRSKFVHYGPRTAILNNLEFDHADIFDDLAQIQRQFHHLVRTVPGSGLIVHPQGEAALDQILAMGCWTPRETFGEGRRLVRGADRGRRLTLPGPAPRAATRARSPGARPAGTTSPMPWRSWRRPATPGSRRPWGIAALGRFAGVKRRMELRGEVAGVKVYDDFAHHPTAIATTLEGLRRPGGRGAHPGGAGAPLQHHAPGGAQRRAGRLPGGRRPGLRLCPAGPGLGPGGGLRAAGGQGRRSSRGRGHRRGGRRQAAPGIRSWS